MGRGLAQQAAPGQRVLQKYSTQHPFLHDLCFFDSLRRLGYITWGTMQLPQAPRSTSRRRASLLGRRIGRQALLACGRVCPSRNEGIVSEPGVRPWFWITIILAVVLVALIIRGYWEWALVALITALALPRLPFIRWPS